jgi:hypothetical protein
VLLQTGQQIGYLSATQAARFEGKVRLLTATVHSRAKDEWGNDTIKLRVVNSADEQPTYKASSSTAKGQSPPVDLIPAVQALQAEAKDIANKEGWQDVLIYFENADGGLYQVVRAENNEHMRQTLQEGMSRVGFIGLHDAPEGIQFTFSLDDSIPMNGIVAKRFLVNAREFLATTSKDLCAQKGVAAPVVHDFEFSKQFLSAQTRQNAAPPKPGVTATTKALLWASLGLIVALFLLTWPSSNLNTVNLSTADKQQKEKLATLAQAKLAFVDRLNQRLLANNISATAAAVTTSVMFEFTKEGPKAARRDGVAPFVKNTFFKRVMRPDTERTLCDLGFQTLSITRNGGVPTMVNLSCVEVP